VCQLGSDLCVSRGGIFNVRERVFRHGLAANPAGRVLPRPARPSQTSAGERPRSCINHSAATPKNYCSGTSIMIQSQCPLEGRTP
jgi:hypothetical protein